MKPLRIQSFGDNVQGIRLRGDPKTCPEPTYVRVAFPGGDVDVVRASDGSYWVHVRANDATNVQVDDDAVAGRIVDARLDIDGRHSVDNDLGDLGHEDLNHLAVRVTRRLGAQ